MSATLLAARPVVADNDGGFCAERRDECYYVTNIIEDAVGTDIGGRAGSAETPHIGRDNMEAGRRNRGDLMPPGIGQFRRAVAKHHQRTHALFEQKNFDPVGVNGASGWHRFSALFADCCLTDLQSGTIGSLDRRRNRTDPGDIR
jgi:hypothetical protein